MLDKQKAVNKWLLAGGFLLAVLFCNAQKTTTIPSAAMTIVPVETLINYDISNTEIPVDTYFKDVNHLLDKYIGVWKGTYNNYSYEFRINQILGGYGDWQEDRLAIRYVITDPSGTVVENTIALPNDSPYVIKGRYFTKTTHGYILDYFGKNAICGQEGEMDISCKSDVLSPTQMKLIYIPTADMSFSSNCVGSATQIMPTTGGIWLTKQ
jgi:hypothetical protein